MSEVIAGAAACDRYIPQSFIAKMLDYTTCMKIDYDQRRPLEVEAIFGNPLRIAQAAGADLPRIATLYQQFKFLTQKNRLEKVVA